MKNLLIGCLVVAALAGLAVIGGVVWVMREGPQLDSKIEVAPEVSRSEVLELVVKLSNPHPDPVVLDSIDIDATLLAGFQVLEITPAPGGTDEVPFFDQRTWSFSDPVAAGASLDVVFRLRPVESGRYSGNLDVCNPRQDCAGHLVDVVVRDTGQ